MATQAPTEKKNILVTGGAGFIGSHLCDELVKHARVVCIDNFLTGSEENINHLLANPDFKFIRQDVTQPIDLDAYPELKLFRIPVQGIQEVYHLACPTSPRDYHQYQVETLLANAFGTKHTLDVAARYKAAYLLASSSAIYGEPVNDTPFVESYWGYVDPIGPRSSYAEGKRFAESLVVNFRERYHVDAKILRIFNTFGPRMKLTDGRVIPDFINDALANRPVEVFGTRADRSSFTYVSDVVEALLKVMTSSELGPLNIGSTEPTTLGEVADTIIRMAGSTSATVERELPAYTAKQGMPDIALAKERLGWFPVVPMEEGLRRTIDHMKGSKVMRFEDVVGKQTERSQ